MKHLTLKSIGPITIIGRADTISAQLAQIAAMHSAIFPRDGQDIDATAPHYNPLVSVVKS